MHGIDIEKAVNEETQKKKGQILSDSEPFFRDPKEYEGMSDQEKEELTQKMMGQLKQWAQGPAVPLGK